MNVIQLSDHVGDQVKRYEAGRHQIEENLSAQYKTAVDQRKTEIREARSRIWRSLTSLAFRDLVYAISDWSRAKQFPLPPKPHKLAPGDNECGYIAGREGEERVLRKLQKSLGKSWTALVGYKSSMGEIDIVAVGPDGIAAIEIKNKVGTISCNGDEWHRLKSGQWETMADAKGRSPSVQINECADQLERVLSQFGVSQHVARLVVLANPRSDYGRPFTTTVDWAGKLDDLKLRKVCRRHFRYRLESQQLSTICDAISRDHQIGTQKTASRRGPENQSPLFEESYPGQSVQWRREYSRDYAPPRRSGGGGILKWVFFGWLILSVVGSVVRVALRPHPSNMPEPVPAPAQPAPPLPPVHKHPHKPHTPVAPASATQPDSHDVFVP